MRVPLCVHVCFVRKLKMCMWQLDFDIGCLPFYF